MCIRDRFTSSEEIVSPSVIFKSGGLNINSEPVISNPSFNCLLYTSDAADDLLCVDLGGRRIIKKKIHSYTLKPSTAPRLN